MDFLLSLKFPLRRGGLFGRGGSMRIDWLPGRDNALSVGLDVPLGQHWMGRTRPKESNVDLPKPAKVKDSGFIPSPELKVVLGNIGEGMGMLHEYTVPFFDDERKKGEKELGKLKVELADFREFYYSKDEDFPDGHTYDATIKYYHRETERAFDIACGLDAGDETGIKIWRSAREILLKEVIIPYNRLLGERKKRDTVIGLGQTAELKFRKSMESTSLVPAGDRDAALYVFRGLVDHIETERKYQQTLWGDSRIVWLPMNFALKTEEHDTQKEIDSLIELAVDQEFTGGNDVHYVMNQQFQNELAHFIHRARDYHVLWIHDYRGLNAVKEPDLIGYRMTLEGYLRALIDRVKEYDETGRIPVYMIFLDQIYFEANKGIIWLELLENPLEHKLKLKKGYEEWEEKIRSAQDELRKAVAESKGLQAGLEKYGKDWLRNRVKVQVNITNPPDFSYRSAHLVKYLFFMPDIVMMDHRKISFYDVTELDPGKGEAIYTGMGVGEHYAGPTWEDRALLARGPALVALKDCAREMLTVQGFRKDEIPYVLRQQKKPENYGDMVKSLKAKGWQVDALQVHNRTGFGSKKANVIKAAIYNLMPAGSHMYIPDSLWNSFLWGGLLTGASTRGCKVFVVAPSLANAPSSGLPQMSRANELFTRFVMIQNEVQDIIEDSGGMFRVGIYDPAFDVDDQIGRGKALEEAFSNVPWMKDVVPFDPSVLEMLAELQKEFEERGFKSKYLAEDVEARRPKLHRKTQLFLSSEVVSTLVPLPGWSDYLEEYAFARAEQVQSDKYVDVKKLRYRVSSGVTELVREWEGNLDAEQRSKLVIYLMAGSHNQNYRSIALDGEALFTVTGLGAMVSYLDFVTLLGSCTWVDSVDQLDKLLPEVEGTGYKFSRGLKKLF